VKISKLEQVRDKFLRLYSKGVKSLKEDGVLIFIKKFVKKIYIVLFKRGNSYNKWIKFVESRYLNDEYMDNLLDSVGEDIKFSVVIPVWNKEVWVIKKALDSVLNQRYSNYEICISDGSSRFIKDTREFLDSYSSKYSNVKVSYLEDREGINIVKNTNNALSMCDGDYIVFMDCDDELSVNCLLELASSIKNNPKAKFIYSDFDHIDKRGKRLSPSFWPDWSPHLLLSLMYTTHITCYSRELIKELNGLREGTDGAQDWDLVLRASRVLSRDEVVHIPKVLYHWRAYGDSTAVVGGNNKGWAYDVQVRVIREHLKELGYDSSLKLGKHAGIFKTDIAVKGNPTVSILIAFRDKVEYLKTCVDSIKTFTEYSNYKIVLVDNQSSERETLEYLKEVVRDSRVSVIKYDKPFHFGKMYNWACAEVDTDYLVILNNDIEVICKSWLTKMLGYAQLSNVGYVGAKLLYPTRKVQHAGILVGHRGVAGHLQVLSDDTDDGYLSSLVTTKNYLALTGACLMISKKKFFEVNGFDESLDPAYQDVDLGIKLYEGGYYNVYMPDAKLIHYESVSRLDEMMSKDLVSDDINAKRLRAKWPKYMYDRRGNDPFYNPNLSYEDEGKCSYNIR